MPPTVIPGTAYFGRSPFHKSNTYEVHNSAIHQHLQINNHKATPSFTMRPASIWTHSFIAIAAASSDRGPQECAVSHGSFDDIAYRYFARSKNCAKMSQVEVIENMLHRNFERLDPENIPSSDCIKFDEGGEWEGWLLYGRLGEVDLAQYCGPQIAFGKGNSRGEL